MVYLLIIFCFVLLAFYFSHPPHNRKYPCAPLLSASQKAKNKSPLRWRQCQWRRHFFFEKRKWRVHRPSFFETRHSFGFMLDFVFKSPSVCPCYYVVFPFSSRPRAGRSSRRAAAPNPRWPDCVRWVAANASVFFFHKVICYNGWP